MSTQPQFVTFHLLSYETPEMMNRELGGLRIIAKALGCGFGRLEVSPSEEPLTTLRAEIVILDRDYKRHVIDAVLSVVAPPLWPGDLDEAKTFAAELRKTILAGLVAEVAKTIGA